MALDGFLGMLAAVALSVLGLVGVGFPIARAIASRIAHGPLPRPGESPGDPRIDALVDEVRVLQSQLDQLAERQDFSERLLAQARERAAIGAPKGNA